jgi:hypothetical protein
MWQLYIYLVYMYVYAVVCRWHRGSTETTTRSAKSCCWTRGRRNGEQAKLDLNPGPSTTGNQSSLVDVCEGEVEGESALVSQMQLLDLIFISSLVLGLGALHTRTTRGKRRHSVTVIDFLLVATNFPSTLVTLGGCTEFHEEESV